jgi:hypothetical protein
VSQVYGVGEWRAPAKRSRDLPGSESQDGFAIHRSVFFGKEILVKT